MYTYSTQQRSNTAILRLKVETALNHHAVDMIENTILFALDDSNISMIESIVDRAISTYNATDKRYQFGSMTLESNDIANSQLDDTVTRELNIVKASL